MTSPAHIKRFCQAEPYGDCPTPCLWRKHRDLIWERSQKHIQDRYTNICNDRDELALNLMDSQYEYFKYCKKPKVVTPTICSGDQVWRKPVVLEIGPCACDSEMKMIPPTDLQRALLYQGHSRNGQGTSGYLKERYDSSLPEYRFCNPPTTNSEYAWKLLESVQCRERKLRERPPSIRPVFYRWNGALVRGQSCAPFAFHQINPPTYH